MNLEIEKQQLIEEIEAYESMFQSILKKRENKEFQEATSEYKLFLTDQMIRDSQAKLAAMKEQLNELDNEINKEDV